MVKRGSSKSYPSAVSKLFSVKAFNSLLSLAIGVLLVLAITDVSGISSVYTRNLPTWLGGSVLSSVNIVTPGGQYLVLWIFAAIIALTLGYRLFRN